MWQMGDMADNETVKQLSPFTRNLIVSHALFSSLYKNMGIDVEDQFADLNLALIPLDQDDQCESSAVISSCSVSNDTVQKKLTFLPLLRY